MIKAGLILCLILITSSCNKQKKSSEFSDDYVLIEFAARLEEDYHKIYPQPLDKHTSPNQN